MATNDRSPPSADKRRSTIDSEAVPGAEVLRETVSEILHELLKDQSQATQIKRQMMSLAASSYQGPIPPPEFLERFDAVVPGSAAQILNMAALEQKHRHSMETKEVIYLFGDSLPGFL